MQDNEILLKAYRILAINLLHWLKNEKRIGSAAWLDEKAVDEYARAFESGSPMKLNDILEYGYKDTVTLVKELL